MDYLHSHGVLKFQFAVSRCMRSKRHRNAAATQHRLKLYWSQCYGKLPSPQGLKQGDRVGPGNRLEKMEGRCGCSGGRGGGRFWQSYTSRRGAVEGPWLSIVVATRRLLPAGGLACSGAGPGLAEGCSSTATSKF